MREDKARGLAFGTGAVILGAVALFAVVQQDGTASPDLGSTPEPPAPSEGAGIPASEADLPAPRPDPAAGPTVGTSPPAPAQDSLLLAGRAVYDDVGCAACHSIAGEGSPRSPLDGVGARLSGEEIRLWIVDPQSARPGIRKPAYDDLSTDDTDALVAYLASLVS